jgi:hypothetical protein
MEVSPKSLGAEWVEGSKRANEKMSKIRMVRTYVFAVRHPDLFQRYLLLHKLSLHLLNRWCLLSHHQKLAKAY